jgi:chromate transport protein ChrA
LIIITLVKKTTKGVTKSDETSGFDNTRAVVDMIQKLQGVVVTLMRILAMWELKEHQQQQQQQASLLVLLVVNQVFLVLQQCQ